MRTALTAAATAATAALVLTGCSFEFSVGSDPNENENESNSDNSAGNGTDEDAGTGNGADLDSAAETGAPGGDSDLRYVPQTEVEAQIVTGLEAETGLDILGAECPGDLPAEEGTVLKCQMDIPSGETLVVDVIVDAVEGTNVDYTTRVTDEVVGETAP